MHLHNFYYQIMANHDRCVNLSNGRMFTSMETIKTAVLSWRRHFGKELTLESWAGTGQTDKQCETAQPVCNSNNTYMKVNLQHVYMRVNIPHTISSNTADLERSFVLTESGINYHRSAAWSAAQTLNNMCPSYIPDNSQYWLLTTYPIQIQFQMMVRISKKECLKPKDVINFHKVLCIPPPKERGLLSIYTYSYTYIFIYTNTVMYPHITFNLDNYWQSEVLIHIDERKLI